MKHSDRVIYVPWYTPKYTNKWVGRNVLTYTHNTDLLTIDETCKNITILNEISN